MATETRTIILEIETKDAQKNVDALEKETKEYNSTVKESSGLISGLTDRLDKMTGGMISSLKGLGGMVKGFKSLRIAVAATGIGLFVVALGTLYTAFQRNQGVMSKFNKILGGIGSVMNNLLDRVGLLGKALVQFASGEFAAAWETAKESVEDLNTSLKESYDLGVDIAENTERNENRRAETRLRIAKNQLEIERLVLVSRDKLNTTEAQRMDALNSAVVLQRENIRLTEVQARLEFETAKQQFEDSSKLFSDKIALQEAEVAYLTVQRQSEAQLRELTNRVVEASNAAKVSTKATKENNEEVEKAIWNWRKWTETTIMLNGQLIFLPPNLKAINKEVEESAEATDKAAQGVDRYAGAVSGLVNLFSDFSFAKVFSLLASLAPLVLTGGGAGIAGALIGGIGNIFAEGGIVEGPSHARGGVKFAVGGRVNELEGGEGVINKRSMDIPWVKTLASQLNQIGGGIKFADGGITQSGTMQVQQFSRLEAAIGLSRPVLVLEDLEVVQRRVNTVEDIATI